MLRMIFVDDEPNLLNGLQRMLRSQRGVWNMQFAESGSEALQMMHAEPADVVVTDMRMPKMNGVELLTAVKVQHPGAIRIILSGHADMETSLRSTLVSHQFLSKPCDAETLKSTIQRSCELKALMTKVGLCEFLGSIGSLPVAPKIYHELEKVLAKEEIEIREVAGIVERDLGITTKILQLVNSSYFGLRREVTSLEQATTHLGARTIRDLVLSFEVFGKFDGLDPRSGIDINREQKHALFSARVAKRMMPDKLAAEEAFLAAMLHDIGKLVYTAPLGDSTAGISRRAEADPRPRYMVEEEEIGVSHAEVGGYLLSLWGLWHPVVEAVTNHHHPSRVTGQTGLNTLGAVHVADALVSELEGDSSSCTPLDEDYLESLGLTTRLGEWRAIAEEEVSLAADPT